MKMFEYMRKENLMKLTADQQKFVAKKIMHDIEHITKEKGISEIEAYALYAKGLYGGEHEMDFS